MLTSIFKLRYGPIQNFVLSEHKKHSSHPLMIIYVHSLEGQKADRFKDVVSANGGLVWYRLVNATEIWQPIDAW